MSVHWIQWACKGSDSYSRLIAECWVLQLVATKHHYLTFKTSLCVVSGVALWSACQLHTVAQTDTQYVSWLYSCFVIYTCLTGRVLACNAVLDILSFYVAWIQISPSCFGPSSLIGFVPVYFYRNKYIASSGTTYHGINKLNTHFLTEKHTRQSTVKCSWKATDHPCLWKQFQDEFQMSQFMIPSEFSSLFEIPSNREWCNSKGHLSLLCNCNSL